MSETERAVAAFMEDVENRNPNEPEFHQAVEEVASAIMPWYLEQDDYRKASIFERLTEPDRTVSFRVAWEDDEGCIRMNRGWRVQFSHALGPYKGGLRFAPTVNQSVLKFLGFEQTLKNSLTGLPMGGAKGGADFDPKDKSAREVRRFCQSLMDELFRHIGPDIDVPAGDIGVGEEEVSVLFGQYLRLSNTWHGALTGKGCSFGGSAVRVEATGYGCVYFCENMLAHCCDESFEDKRLAISGAGNVALHAAEKAIERGAKVVSLSNSDGCAHFPDGLTREDYAALREARAEGRRLDDFADGRKGAEFLEAKTPWRLDCDIAMPCATQNEVDEEDAEALVDAGVLALCEGANMPLTKAAADRLKDGGVLHGPGKAANAGGVAVSGLEQSQNAQRLAWSREKVDSRLKEIIKDIHDDCVENGKREGERVDYVCGANLAAFKRVARALHSFWVF